MILPETVAQEQSAKNEEKSFIISLALEIYPHLVAQAKSDAKLNWYAKRALLAAQVFVEEASQFNA